MDLSVSVKDHVISRKGIQLHACGSLHEWMAK